MRTKKDMPERETVKDLKDSQKKNTSKKDIKLKIEKYVEKYINSETEKKLN